MPDPTPPPPTLSPSPTGSSPTGSGPAATGRETLQVYLDTHVPHDAPTADAPTEEHPRARLPVIVIGRDQLRAGEVDLVMEDLLGRGGMAEVRAAAQLALGRRVAIKRARDPGRANQRRALLREAWLAGQLEHPGIVPVHQVGETPDGEAVVVMKELRGEPWDRMLQQTPDRRGEALATHVEILLRVCQATAYAHSHGVVHRDIKPANVRLGEFGEVYLVDWGIAAHHGGPPTGPAGTPAYMAPEMYADASPDVRMDVYLIGSVLHEIWAGFPATEVHREEGFPAMRSAPSALAALVRQCCAEDPAERPADAAVVAASLAIWLRDRGTEELLQASLSRLDEAEQAIEALDAEPDQGEHLVTARERLAGAHFGFEQVLDQQPDHPQALDGLRQLRLSGVRLDLARRDPAAAATFLSHIDDPPPELVARVSAALAADKASRAETARLERLGRRFDLDSVRTRRSRLMGGFAAVLVGVLTWPYIIDALDLDVNRYLLRLTMVLTISAAYGLLAWRSRDDQDLSHSARRALELVPALLLIAIILRSIAVFTEPENWMMLMGELWLTAGVMIGAGDLFRYNVLLAVIGCLGAAGIWLFPAWGPDLYNVAMISLVVGAGLDVRSQKKMDRS